MEVKPWKVKDERVTEGEAKDGEREGRVLRRKEGLSIAMACR